MSFYLRGLAVGVLFASGVAGASHSARAAEAKTEKKGYEVETIEDVAYYQAKDADKVKHKLDLYLPKGRKDFPVLFFVHGGAWRMGDKGQFGIYRALGKCFARRGIGLVAINYRLSPKVKHPAHIQDVARAFAWTYKTIQKYGGRPDAIFLSGHSAGGHLVALLATDDTYLKAEGLGLKAIRGVIPLSGVFRIPDPPLLVSVFGKDKAARTKASPITHVRADAPPFLILYADRDFPHCGKRSAQAFGKALQEKKCPADVLEIKDRSHLTILLNALADDDPVPAAILQFIKKYGLAKKGS
jgi:acetyl esterase/lipase